jgi:hypothetical protein
MTDYILVEQSPKQMVLGEAIAFTIDFTDIGTPASVTSFLAYDATGTDVSSATLSGSTSINSYTVTGKLFTPASAQIYRLACKVAIGTNTYTAPMDVIVGAVIPAVTSVGANSYGTLAEVLAFTKHLLDGSTAFSAFTRPTNTEVKSFIDRLSGVLNLALATAGFTIPVSQATAKLACDDWVITKAAAYVELTARSGGDDQENSRWGAFLRLQDAANKFVNENRMGFINLGVGVTRAMSAGIQFTGLTKQSDRVDRTDTSIEQPLFERHAWDVPGTSGLSGDGDE